MKRFFHDKRIWIIYVGVILLLAIGLTYAIDIESLAINTNTAIIRIDEEAYGDTVFDTTDLDFRPILDSNVESSPNNVIKIEFKVGAASNNTTDSVIYDIALNDMELNCNLLSPYVKWKLLKNDEEISNGSLDYQFDTMIDGRMVLTTIQQDLVEYNATDKSGYDSYTFYMWLSDFCQSSDISTCISNNQVVDQSSLLGQNISGKVEVELYTESKKELVRNPGTSVNQSYCSGKYVVTFDTNSSEDTNPIYVATGSTYDALPTLTKTVTATFETDGGTTYDDITDERSVTGWYLDKNLTQEVTNTSTVSLSENHTLYAKWTDEEVITMPTPTKEGYLFVGWYTDDNFENKVTVEEYNLTENVTFYARWMINITCTLSISSATYDTVTTQYACTTDNNKIMSYNITMEKNNTETCSYNAGTSGVQSISDSCTFEAFDLSTIKLEITDKDSIVTTYKLDETALEEGYNIIYEALNDEYEAEKNGDYLLDRLYPVGSIYISTSSTNPSTIYGGTWESFASGRTLIGMGSNGTNSYTTVNSTGGIETVSLATTNLPSHLHSITPSGSVSSTFTGTSVNTSTNGTTHNHATAGIYKCGSYSLDSSSGFRNRPIVTSSVKMTTSTSGAHTHTLTASGTVSSTFSGTSSKATGSTGSGTSFNVVNPYIVTYMWRRTA